MSEEDRKLQKHLVDEMMKVSETNPDVMFYMEALMKKYEELEQKVEQLEKENKELNRMCELYGQSLYSADLTKAEKRVEQLENIRKEAIEYNKELTELYDIGSMERSNADTNLLILKDEETLNILNKGSDKE